MSVSIGARDRWISLVWTVACLSLCSCSLSPYDEAADPEIHQAVEYAQYQRVSDLVADGADVDEADQWGDTPLMSASGTDERMVELLLSLGANPNARNAVDGWAPLTYAVYRGSLSTVETLIAAGASEGDPPQRGRVKGQSLCEIARTMGHTSVADSVC